MNPAKLQSASPTPRSFWRFPLAVQKDANGLRLQIEWGRLALLLAVLAVIAWLALAGTVFLWVKYQRGFSEVRFLDIVQPYRWGEFRVARGDFYIREAKTELTEQHWGEAIHHLRVGVATSPSNTEGRLLLAHFFTIAGRLELAQRILREGIPYSSDNPDFLKALFGFLLQYQEDAEIERIAADLLPPKPALSERNQLIAVAAANAALYRGHFDRAGQLIRDYDLEGAKSIDGRILAARLDWERGNPEAAIRKLKAYTTRFPGTEEFYTQLVKYYRDMGQESEVEQFALLRAIANPGSTAARLDLLRTYLRHHDSAHFERELTSLLANFDDNLSALLAIANFGTEIGDPSIPSRVARRLRETQRDADACILMVAEAHIVAKEYQAALDFLAEAGRTHPEWLKKFFGIANGLQAVAAFGLGQAEEGELYLSHFLSLPNLRTEQLTAVANRLIEVDAKPQARRALLQAIALNERNQTALARLVEIDLDRAPTDELIANLNRLLEMRRPALSLLRKAQARLNSDRFLFVEGRDATLDAIQAAIDQVPASVPSPS